ncbi:MAG: transketolase C-terminal domain-containing protein, partial [Dehalococcoidales bacterium]|nr:transketolase C-terminal domain-containing protein [Dehalococcoidales bacterium]
AIGAAIYEEMERDESVLMWGVGVSASGATWGEAAGLEKFGERVKGTPIVEQAVLGSGMGAALTGSRPIVNMGTAGFMMCAAEGMLFEVGGLREEFGYTGPMPLVIFCRIGVGAGFGGHHTASTEAYVMHSPGLKVAVPSNPYDAKGLLKTAIRDDGPVVFMTTGSFGFTVKQEIPAEEYLIPFGQADIKREGSDITIVAWASIMPKVLAAAEELGKQGISVEVVDPRTLVPLDIKSIVKSVEKTGRLLIAHDAMKRGGAAGEIAFRVAEEAPDVWQKLKNPMRRIAAKNVALPRSRELELQLIPNVEDIVATVKDMV